MPTLETRFFSLTKIPRPAFVEAEFSYNYFVPDEATNDTGISKYDNSQFSKTSYKTDEGGSYTTDDQGNKLLLDNFGNLVSEDVLSTRAPRYVSVSWTAPTLTTTTPNPPADALSDLDAAGLIMREEEISSVYDTSVKVFDPKLRTRLDEKLRLLSALSGQDPYTDEGLQSLLTTLVEFAEENNSTTGMPGYADFVPSDVTIMDTSLIQSAVPRIIDMNKSAGERRVNDLGVDAESGQFEAAATYLADTSVDRRLLNSMAHSVYDRNYFAKRQVMRHTSQDSDRNLLPKEPDRIVGNEIPGETREAGLALTSPILVAQTVARPIEPTDGSAVAYAQTDILGYIVERYRITPDFSLDVPEKRVYIDSPLVNNLIDTEVLYGVSYYYTIRAVYMRESELFDYSISDFSRVRSYFACTATDPVYIETTESTPPKEPDGLFYKFNHRVGSGLILTWQYPVGKQRDTKYFQIFRRSSIDEPFTCIKEIDFNNAVVKTGKQESVHEENILYYNGTTTYFEDIEFTRDSSYIYAVAAIDAHGLSSGYSAQTYASFKKERNKLILKNVSPPGAPKQYPNFFIDPELDDSTFVRTLTQDVMKSSGKQTVKIYMDADIETFGIEGGTIETHLGFATTGTTYKMHFINLDRHKDESIEIRFTDFRES